MITFLPQRPAILIADLWQSKAGDIAYDKGYDWYCQTYYEALGVGHYTQWEAERYAERAGLHMTMINLQSHCEQVERKAELEAQVEEIGRGLL